MSLSRIPGPPACPPPPREYWAGLDPSRDGDYTAITYLVDGTITNIRTWKSLSPAPPQIPSDYPNGVITYTLPEPFWPRVGDVLMVLAALAGVAMAAWVALNP